MKNKPRKDLPDGMATRPGRDGYYANFQKNGTRCRQFLSTDYHAACRILNELKVRADKAEFAILDNAYPLADLRKTWLAYCKQYLASSTVNRYEGCLNNIMPALAVVKVSQVTLSAVVNYREQRLVAGKSPRTINAEVQALGCMFNWGVNPGKLLQSNPLRDLKPLPHHNPKEGRPLTPDEMRALFDASSSYWRDIWYAYGVTGFRAGELICMEFTAEFIDWDNREVMIPKRLVKNHQEKRVPMDDHLYEILRRLEAGRADRQPGRGRKTDRVIARFSRDRVFVSTADTPLDRHGLYKAFLRCCRKAGIRTRTHDSEGNLLCHVDLHSLRRTFITEAISNGADPGTVQQLAGHKSLRITMNIYHKASRQTRRAAIGKLSYGEGASAPEHIIPLPESPRCHQDGTTEKTKPETDAS